MGGIWNECGSSSRSNRLSRLGRFFRVIGWIDQIQEVLGALAPLLHHVPLLFTRQVRRLTNQK